MDSSLAAASWLSLVASFVALGYLLRQLENLMCQSDTSHPFQDDKQLSRWSRRQLSLPWYYLGKASLVGPAINADLLQGFCGRTTIAMSRVPLVSPTGKVGWDTLLAVLHSPGKESGLGMSANTSIIKQHKATKDEASFEPFTAGEWDSLPLCPLLKHQNTPCISINRTTFMALLSITNARPVFCHSSAAGFRASYASYPGLWRVEWPLGDLARVYFSAHDCLASLEGNYPVTLELRVDKCLQMLAGVIQSHFSSDLRCAFPGRKGSGFWILCHAVKGFSGAHSGRHFYNMMGGNPAEVDFLLMRKSDAATKTSEDMLVFQLPSNERFDHEVTLYVPRHESTILNHALDCLPWSSLSWSVHRGLRDILLAFGKDRMDRHRVQLAKTLRTAVSELPHRLDARGWDSAFVRSSMADMAAGAVLAGIGNSGDLVRIVTDVALILWDDTVSALDETTFWRNSKPIPCSSTLRPMAVIALVKYFVLEWSNELDYQMYHDIPLDLYLG